MPSAVSQAEEYTSAIQEIGFVDDDSEGLVALELEVHLHPLFTGARIQAR